MIKRLPLFFIFIFFAAISTAQTISIQGHVIDTIAKTPLQNAVSMVVKLKDSTLVKFTRSDKEGLFKLDALPIDTYIVIVSHRQFADQTFIVVGNNKQTQLDFGKIILPPKTNTLNEVVVYGYRDKIYYKGDTLTYTADSFKVKQNATVEDLLKKLPGVKVDAAGKITVQGKEVSQVLVDGDEFFGSDPTIATKNLGAKTVESVQVYEKKSEDTESKEETVKIMNLKLKEEAKRGYFGKTSVAGGADGTLKNNFYEGEVLANRFNNKRKISLFGLGANSPRQKFNWNDIWQYGLDNETNMSTDDDGNQTWTNNNQQSGVPQTLKTGFYYNDKFGKRTKLNTDYTFSQNTLNTNGSTNTQYFLTDTSYSDAQTNTGKASNQVHNFGLKFTQGLDSLTDLTFKPKINYSTSSASTLKTDDFISADNVLTRQTQVKNDNNNTTLDASALVSINRKFKKKDRNLYVSYYGKSREENTKGYLNSTNHYFLPKDSVINVNQEKTNVNSNTTHEASIVYTEPLSPKVKLEFSYDYSYNNSIQDRKTRDYSGTAYDLENPTLTNNFNNLRQVHRGGAKFIYEVKKFRLSFGGRGRQVQQSSTNVSTGIKLSQIVNNVLPSANFNYRFSQNKNLRVNYTSSSTQPDLNQMQPVQNNTDPNRISLGNPNLKPSFTQAMDLNFYSFKPITGSNYWAGGNFSTTNNSIAYTTTYDNGGVATTQPVNVNGNYNTYGWIGCNVPVLSKLFYVNPNINLNYSNNVNYINGLKNITKEAGGSAQLTIGHDGDKFSFSVDGNYNYSNPKSTISSQSSQPYGSYQLSGQLSYKFPKHFTIETDANYNKNTRRASGYNISYVIWNASISKTFLKSENIILSLDAYDILNQNISTNRSVQDNRIVDSKNQIIKQYFLVKLLFKFNSNKAKTEDD